MRAEATHFSSQAGWARSELQNNGVALEIARRSVGRCMRAQVQDGSAVTHLGAPRAPVAGAR